MDLKTGRLTLFLAGAGLSIAQFIMVRDFVSVLYGEEVVITLVVAAFFTGMSAGYLFSLRFSDGLFRVLFVISAFLHLTFPFSYRYLAVWLDAAGGGGVAFLCLLFGYALIFSGMYSAFLPRLVHLHLDAERGLKEFYTAELLGFLAGFVIVGLTWNRPLPPLLYVYWSLLGGLLLLTAGRRWTAGYAACAALAAFYAAPLDISSSSALYREKHGIENAQVLYSVNSPYQRVEVVQGGRGELMLYLDGLMNLNSTDLEHLNYFIAELPARLVTPGKALIIGNGTLSSVSKVYPHAGSTVSVELDPAVLKAGLRFFTPPESLEGLENWRLVNDDGKHFMKTSGEVFNLIVMDVPSPLTIQEAFLHTVEFYRTARESMPPDGVIAVQLSGRLEMDSDRTPARVAAALDRVFGEVMVIYSPRADRGFAYAADKLPFGPRDLLRIAKDYDRETEVIPPYNLRYFLKKAEPLELDNMDLVLRRGLERVMGRYF